MVDLSIQSRISRVDGSDEDIRPADATEILQTLVIPVVPVFSVSTQTTYMRRTTPASGPADLTNFGPDYWDDSLSGNALISTVLNCTDCIGASTIIIKNIRLVPEVCRFPFDVQFSSVEAHCLGRSAFTGHT